MFTATAAHRSPRCRQLAVLGFECAKTFVPTVVWVNVNYDQPVRMNAKVGLRCLAEPLADLVLVRSWPTARRSEPACRVDASRALCTACRVYRGRRNRLTGRDARSANAPEKPHNHGAQRRARVEGRTPRCDRGSRRALSGCLGFDEPEPHVFGVRDEPDALGHLDVSKLPACHHPVSRGPRNAGLGDELAHLVADARDAGRRGAAAPPSAATRLCWDACSRRWSPMNSRRHIVAQSRARVALGNSGNLARLTIGQSRRTFASARPLRSL